MKKLLALILCVVMVLSLAPAAFAAYDTSDQRVWRGASQTKDIVNALRTNVESMYGSIAANNGVFQTVKAIDDMMDGLVKEMVKDYNPTSTTGVRSLSGSDLKDAVMAGLRSTIGGEISDYLTKHAYEYYTYDSLGNRIFNPSKYAGVFATAASNAVSSEKAVAGIQAYMYYILQRSTFNQAWLDAESIMRAMNSFDHWGDYGFDDFANGIAGWAVPNGTLGQNVDGTMHDIFAIYQEWLTPEGMIGADLNRDGAWDTGRSGGVTDIDGIWWPSIGNADDNGKGNENSESAFATGAHWGQ